MLDRRQFVAATTVALGTLQGCSSMDLGGSGGVGGGNVGSGAHRVGLPAVGSTVAINNIGLGGQGVAVTRLATNTIVAVSRQCTHQGCTINLPGGPGQNMQCPCHGSIYTTTGSVVQGPSGGPLLNYAASIDSVTNEAVVTIP